uniref:EGF-like domain-containing protein n=1 Tax=Steinernema glaseri TaxID=37863 RepID=A0A1I7Y0D1_9BILA
MSELLYVVGVGVIALLTSALATVCTQPSETASVAENAATGTFRYKNAKTCPDFKDDERQTECCVSQITPGTFYCCTEERKFEIESEIAAEDRRQFIRNYLALIIVCSVVLLLFLFVGSSIICKRCSKCPMYREKQFNEQSSRYRPVDSVVTSKQVLYEAPPPYDFGTSRAVSNPPSQVVAQRSHDWHCLLENEVNDSRQTSAP